MVRLAGFAMEEVVVAGNDLEGGTCTWLVIKTVPFDLGVQDQKRAVGACCV
jgi:hypothetical protein